MPYPVRPRDARASREQREDTERRNAVTAAYEQTSSAADAKQSSCGQLMKIAKVYLSKWDTEKREKTRARNALKQLTGVPLTADNCTWPFESSLRQAFQAAITEEAESEGQPTSEAEYKTWRECSAVRAAFLSAIRIDADQADVRHVLSAVKQFDKHSSKGGDDEQVAAPYLSNKEG